MCKNIIINVWYLLLIICYNRSNELAMDSYCMVRQEVSSYRRTAIHIFGPNLMIFRQYYKLSQPLKTQHGLEVSVIQIQCID